MTVTWRCGECLAIHAFTPDFDGDMPDGWFRVEDRECVYVACSLGCLVRFVQGLERTSLLAAVDPIPANVGKAVQRAEDLSSSALTVEGTRPPDPAPDKGID